MLRRWLGLRSIPLQTPVPQASVLNSTDALLLVQIEPWGEDYWVQPGDRCDVVGESGSPDGQFIVDVHEASVAVWSEGGIHSFEVRIGNEVVNCGHNRPEGWP